MRIRLLIIFLFLATFASAQVVSDFSTDADGWTTNDADGLPTYNAGGYITGNDYSIPFGAGPLQIYWSFIAPAKFTGNKVAYYNGTLSFDLQQTITRPWVQNADIQITSGTTSIYYYNITPNYPATAPGWTTYTIPLNEKSGLWKNAQSPTAAAAAQSDVQFALQNCIGIYIRGRYGATTSTGSIDNVKLQQFLVTPQPAVTTTVCAGTTVMLTTGASGAFTPLTYQWQSINVATGAIANLTNGAVYGNVTTPTLSIFTGAGGAGSYRCRISSPAANDIYSNNALVNINALPGSPGTSGNTGCTGSTQLLTASGGTAGNYRWYTVATGGTAIAGQTAATYTTPALSGTTTYYAVITNGTCESLRIPVTATVIAIPGTPGASGGSSCTPAAITLTATGGTAGQYRWYTVATGGTAIAGQTNATYTTPVISTTTPYYVALNNGTCQGNRMAVNATILTPPAAPVTTSGNRCGPGTVSVSATGGTAGQYRWYTVATGGTSDAGQTNATYTTPTITTTTPFYVAINNGSCEGARTVVSAVVNNLPTTPTITNASGCVGTSVTLNAAGGAAGQYRWYTVASGGTAIGGATNAAYVTPILLLTTTYYVSINNGTCEGARAPVTATMSLVPGAPGASNASSCTSPASLSLTATGGTAGQYRWYTVATGGTAIAGQTNATYTTPSLTSSTTYYVSLVSGICESSRKSVLAAINTPPSAPTGIPGTGCGTSSVSISASGGATGQYRWYTASTGGTAIAGETNQTYITPQLAATTTFYASINNGTCEGARTAIDATILAVPNDPVVTPAKGFEPGISLTLKASGTTDGNYRWYVDAASSLPISGEVNSVFQTPIIDATTIYYVSIVNGICESQRVAVQATIAADNPPAIQSTSSSVEVAGVVTIPIVDLLSDPDNNLDSASLRVVTQPHSGASATFNKNLQLVVDYKGVAFSGTDSLVIEVCDNAGLCAQQTIYIQVFGEIIVYNGISPNGDDLNEILLIEHIEALDETRKNHFSLYDRWGDSVFEVDDYDNNTHVFKGIGKSGDELPAGTYYYKIVFASGKKTAVGNIALRK